MTRSGRRCALYFFLFFTGLVSIRAQENLMDYQNSLKFARYLTHTKQYTFASQEYERLNFLWPGDSAVVIELVTTYRLNQDCGKFQKAYSLLSMDQMLFRVPAYSKEYLRYCLTCRLNQRDYFQLIQALEPEEKAFYTLGYHWMREQPDSAVYMVSANSWIRNLKNQRLVTLTREFGDHNYKKPALAMAMSTLLPGSGKAYSKEWADASISLLFISSTAYASYRAFRKKGIRSLNGWIFGSVSFSFYASNIYGSFKAAKRYNERVRNTYQKNAEAIVYSSF